MSCEPETLARDLDHLARLGFRAATVTPFDLMPHTSEVESVAILAPATPPPPEVLHRHGRLLFLGREAHESATDLLRRARATLDERPLSLAFDAGVEASGVCVFARDASAPSIAVSHASYLALVRGIVHAKGTIRKPVRVGARSVSAVTRFQRVAVIAGHSLVRATIDPCDPLVLRKQFASLNHPVLGDERFGHAPSNRHVGERYGLDRPFVHLETLTVTEPDGANPRDVHAPLASDLAGVAERMGWARD